MANDTHMGIGIGLMFLRINLKCFHAHGHLLNRSPLHTTHKLHGCEIRKKNRLFLNKNTNANFKYFVLAVLYNAWQNHLN